MKPKRPLFEEKFEPIYAPYIPIVDILVRMKTPKKLIYRWCIMNNEEKLARLDKFAKSLDSSAKVILKDDSWLMKVIAWLFSNSNPEFMSRFATTIVRTVYIPEHWLTENKELRPLMCHEVLGHIKQMKLCGLGIHPWLGFPLYTLIYGLLPFIVGIAYFRYRLELACDVHAWKYGLVKEIYTNEYVMIRSESFMETVCSWNYLKSWFTKLAVRRGLRRAEEVVAEYQAGKYDDLYLGVWDD